MNNRSDQRSRSYLTQRRMERAKPLLDDGMPVTHVALSVGYSNPSKFAAAFRPICGCSPSAWRSR
ncbi:helix-turn-helix domain-containing protein [Sphingomonas pollutisoli]|uniref:helix-turn-helix domain-containing protein n=1 Tax=Sphingomonas pollutisoli TaxID=3030829 RepID=UPI003B835020